jgi:glycosyltransferase involved in cell wall biosynthesis
VPAASVIVPARDAAATLGSLLDALAAQDLAQPFEVIVVDDGSSDRTAELARAHPAVTTVLDQEPAGPGAARNRGAAAASAPVLAFTDADCAPEPAWLRRALEVLEGGADLVQGAVLPPEGALLGPFDRAVWVTRVSHLYETANLVLRRELFERLGGFEPWLTPRAGGKELAEDVWLGWRARRSGARVTYEPGALVRHAVEQRGAPGYVAERARLRFFPAMASRVPELREAFFYRRLFLNRRSALFDLALAGVLAAAMGRRALPLAAAIPYLRLAAQAASGWPERSPPAVFAVQLTADAVGLGALAWGSVRRRTLLL